MNLAPPGHPTRASIFPPPPPPPLLSVLDIVLLHGIVLQQGIVPLARARKADRAGWGGGGRALQ